MDCKNARSSHSSRSRGSDRSIPPNRFAREAALVALLALAGLASPLAAQPADYQVSPNGRDTWSGRRAEPAADGSDGPFATLERAIRAVRELRGREPKRLRPVVVEVDGGVYRLEQPILFEPEDSGTAVSPAIYRAREGTRPVLSGGRVISGWKVGDDGRWRAEIPEARNGGWVFSQLFASGQRRFRPRRPAKGYFAIEREVAPSPKAKGRGHDRFGYAAGDIRPDWAERGDVEVLAFHEWSASRMRIASIDAAARVVTFTGHSLSSGHWGKYLKGHRYLVINERDALGRPGQWYLDRNEGVLTYIPRPGETPESTEIVAPRLENLVLFRGAAAGRRWVSHIRLEGLTFAHTRWSLPPEGQAFPQAEIGLNAAVDAFGARHVDLAGCAVLHTGGYAIAFGSGSRYDRVLGCELVDLAGGGIKIGHAGPGSWADVHRVPDDPEAVVSHIEVRGSLIASAGRLHPAAVGVWIGHSPFNVVAENTIRDLYYTGLSVGWTWGYAPSLAHHNEIAANHVHTIGQGVLSDMGAIYTLGVSPGTMVHDNWFHDVVSFSYGGWGLYTDEGSSRIVMERNLVERCSRGTFHQHYGRENRVRNNILVQGGQHQLQRTRTEPHTSFFLERNIVLWDNGSPLLGSNWRDDHFVLERNLYWPGAGKPLAFPGGLDLAAWREKRGHDLHSLVADPLFADPSHGDYRLRPGSPARKIGFEPFDATRAGRREPPRLTAGLPPVPRAFD